MATRRPFFGGPGNDYTGHAIVSAALRLRESGRLAYVAGNGGFLSKHLVGISGSQPPLAGFRSLDTSKEQSAIDAAALPVASETSGEATVVAGTVVYARDGSVERAPVIAALADGTRIVANAACSVLPGLAG